MTSKPSGQSVASLIEAFIQLGTAQPPLNEDEDAPAFDRHSNEMSKIASDLIALGPEGRAALIKLTDHAFIPIRFQAAKASLGIAKDRAVEVLSDIMEMNAGTLSASAGMTLMFAGEFDLMTGLKRRPKPFPPEWEWKPKGPSR